jgi:prophage maintenance system killer protein
MVVKDCRVKGYAINQHGLRRHTQKARRLGKRTGSAGLFGQEKDDSFKGSLATIHQTFGGKALYSSIEEKAANLLYFEVKNQSFVDGNKRIAAFLFPWFPEKNGMLYKPRGGRTIADNAFVALTLMIAESKSRDRDSMLKVIINLINKRN